MCGVGFEDGGRDVKRYLGAPHWPVSAKVKAIYEGLALEKSNVGVLLIYMCSLL